MAARRNTEDVRRSRSPVKSKASSTGIHLQELQSLPQDVPRTPQIPQVFQPASEDNPVKRNVQGRLPSASSRVPGMGVMFLQNDATAASSRDSTPDYIWISPLPKRTPLTSVLSSSRLRASQSGSPMFASLSRPALSTLSSSSGIASSGDASSGELVTQRSPADAARTVLQKEKLQGPAKTTTKTAAKMTTKRPAKRPAEDPVPVLDEPPDESAEQPSDVTSKAKRKYQKLVGDAWTEFLLQADALRIGLHYRIYAEEYQKRRDIIIYRIRESHHVDLGPADLDEDEGGVTADGKAKRKRDKVAYHLDKILALGKKIDSKVTKSVVTMSGRSEAVLNQDEQLILCIHDQHLFAVQSNKEQAKFKRTKLSEAEVEDHWNICETGSAKKLKVQKASQVGRAQELTTNGLINLDSKFYEPSTEFLNIETLLQADVKKLQYGLQVMAKIKAEVNDMINEWSSEAKMVVRTIKKLETAGNLNPETQRKTLHKIFSSLAYSCLKDTGITEAQLAVAKRQRLLSKSSKTGTGIDDDDFDIDSELDADFDNEFDDELEEDLDDVAVPDT